MTGRILKLSDEQKTILKGAFERFPNPDHHSDALRMVSEKTGLKETVIRRWFEKKRETLCKNIKTSDEEDVQILDGRPVNPEVGDDDIDFVELDDVPQENKNQESNCNKALSSEDKAAEYDKLKIQMETLKKQMLQMSQSLDQRESNHHLQPPQQPQQFYQPHHQQYLPYPVQDYHQSYHQPLSFPYNPYSPWHLPYPPPDFRIVFLNPPPPQRTVQYIKSEPAETVKEKNAEVNTPRMETNIEGADASFSSVEKTKETPEPNNETSEDHADDQEEIVLDKQVGEKEHKKVEKLIDIVENFQKQVHDAFEKDNLEALGGHIVVTPTKKRLSVKGDQIESSKKRYRLTPYKNNNSQGEIHNKISIDESLEKAQQEIDEFEKMLEEIDPIEKDTTTYTHDAKKTTAADEEEDGKEFYCEECGSEFSRRQQLTQHMRSAHEEDPVVQGGQAAESDEVEELEPESPMTGREDGDDPIAIDNDATQEIEDDKGIDLDETVFLESETERSIETEDGSTVNVEEVEITIDGEPSWKVIEPPKEPEKLVTVTETLEENIASNLSFDEALNLPPVIEEKEVEAEVETPAIEFLGEDAPSTSLQQSKAPIPFIVKQEPQEPRKVGRRALANKSRNGPYQKPATPPPLINSPPRPAPGPVRTQQPLILAQQQKDLIPPLIQPQQQQPRFVKVAQPVVKRPSPSSTPELHPILQQQQRTPRSAPPLSQQQPQIRAHSEQPQKASPHVKQPPRVRVNNPATQSRRKPQPGGGGRSKTPRTQQPRVLPGMVGAAITVTKVVEPPAPPPPTQRPAAVNPASRPQLQRILGMRNLSVSINRN